ncbi:MAG: SAM-dependent methyltransferase [Actinobacteria bacterium]|nr:SAM-dependent methyltransferase [Actinomycetota bacterium]MBU1944027.1 SAM-dependent methyltransferase [Actinomycetota bacterium]MBU2688523.1 SAM-dependent methyltransferase [Actinomycetota bacterium]
MSGDIEGAAKAVPGSFRDPSGFLFERGGVLYRQVNERYREDYELLVKSGLYRELTAANLLVEHRRADVEPPDPDVAYLVIEPERIPFISYPYEWCFSQLKAAALATIALQRKALAFGMSLKDASAYNIQFLKGRPLLIDTLSFERYREGNPWVAYGQFCRHFLAPLCLMAYRDVRLGLLLRDHIDGVPLDLASTLMPARTWLRPPVLMHLHLHARSERKYSEAEVDPGDLKDLSRKAFFALLDSLESAVRRLRWKPEGTEWVEYYDESNYTEEAFESKIHIVGGFLKRTGAARVWDIGGNVGVFSRIAAGTGASTVCMDVDPACVERNYLRCVRDGDELVLPLVVDLFNPSPAIGWECRERMSLPDRGPTDAVLALAVVHHLAISNNVPLDRIASFLADLGEWLIIEFVPKSDSQVARLLSVREDIFSGYTVVGFLEAFSGLFRVEDREPVGSSERVIFLMRKR